MLATMNMKWGVAAPSTNVRSGEGNAFAESGESADASRPDEDRVGLIGGVTAPLPAGGGPHRRGPSFGPPGSGGGGGHARTDSDSAADDITPRGGGLGALLGGGGPKGLVSAHARFNTLPDDVNSAQFSAAARRPINPVILQGSLLLCTWATQPRVSLIRHPCSQGGSVAAAQRMCTQASDGQHALVSTLAL